MNILIRINRKIKWLRAKQDKKKQFRSEFLDFFARSSRSFELKFEDTLPCLNDRTATTNFDAHYIYHPAWAARIVKKVDPPFHIDISSTLHFCSLLSAFIPVHFYDFRPAELKLDNLFVSKADLTDLIFETDSVDCISCMHTIEHVGLGRYGDPIDPDGDLKAIYELQRVVKPGGSLLLVVPVGQPKIVFNAHRIYSTREFLGLFEGFTLMNFAYVNDENEFYPNAYIFEAENLKYGCGCFWFKKNKSN